MKIYLISGSWCGPCQQMKKGIEKLINKEVFVIDVGTKEFDAAVNEVPEILSIVSVPTTIAVYKGEILDSHSGVMTAEELKQWIIIQERWVEENEK